MWSGTAPSIPAQVRMTRLPASAGTRAIALAIAASAIALVPALAGSLVIRTWAGIDGAMPDHIPVLGFSATTPDLVHAFGFSGHGFQLGPIVGEIIAELLTEGRSLSPLAPFAIERFAGATAAPCAPVDVDA